jgi:integrase
LLKKRREKREGLLQKGFRTMAKRGNGEGSIFQRKSDKKWIASITLENGKRKVFYGKTKKEVTEKLIKARSEQQQGLLSVNSKTKMSEYIEGWLESYKRSVRPNTHQRACEIMRLHVLPTLGNLQLDKLTPRHLDRLYTKKLEELSPTTVQTIHNTIHKALSDAIKQGILLINVSERVEAPRKNEYEARVFSEEEIQAFLLSIQNHPLYVLLLMDVAIGLRRGEIVGIQWRDLDLKKGIVQVRRAIVRRPTELGGGYAEAPLKTKKSRRSIMLPASIVAILEQYRAQQMSIVQQSGQQWDEQRWLFCKPDGNHLNPQHDVYEVFKELLKKAGLPNIRFHDLRHTAATMHLGMMTNPKIVQEILGHSQISVTMDAYSHVLPPMHKNAMESINEWLVSHTVSQEENLHEFQKKADEGERKKKDDDSDDGQGSGVLAPV